MSKKLQMVALNSFDAKYMALFVATREVAWLGKLIKDFGLEINQPITIHCSNEASMKMATNPKINQHTKHITI